MLICGYIDWTYQQALVRRFGLFPRSIRGLPGVACAPFLHGSLIHMLGNIPPFLIFGTLIRIRGRAVFFRVLTLSLLASGAGTWLAGREYLVHVGASGIVYGFWGFLLAVGWFERRWSGVFLSITLAWIFCYYLLGMLPGLDETQSWEMHVFGFCGGVIAAWMLARPAVASPDPVIRSNNE